MICPRCDQLNPAGARFCLQCGSRLALACPTCGALLPDEPNTRFCMACGSLVSGGPVQPSDAVGVLAPLSPSPQSLPESRDPTRVKPADLAGERRTVTILFCDVKGSTALAEHLDPEEVAEIMAGAFQVLSAPIGRYEGTLARLMGDAVLAFFGAPAAHDDDPERAVRASLEMIEETRKYAQRLERERGITGFNVRVGINTGLVVAGEIGSDLRSEYTVMGDAANVASRLESAAEPGSVLVSESTYKLVAHAFEVEPLGPIRVPGRLDAIPTFRVVAPLALTGKPRGIAGLGSPLVGRETELAALTDAVQQLKLGIGGIVTVTGDAGIGKSRLVAEARSRAQGVRWLEGRCLSHGKSLVYHLWLDLCRNLLGLSAGATAGEAPERIIRKALGTGLDGAAEIYPALAQLLAGTSEPAGAGIGEAESAGEVKRQVMFRAVSGLLELASRRRPLVAVCEDLQWADATSLDLLERCLSLTDRAPILFVCVSRPEPEHGSWRIREIAARLHGHHHTDLALQPLTASESEALVRHLLGPLADGSGTTGLLEGAQQKLVWRILGRSEGNPFYVEEMIRSLIDSGVLVREPDSGRWAVVRDVGEIAIPDTLGGVLTARIDRLPAGTRRVLQVAAVIGRVFSHEILAAIMPKTADLDGHLLLLQREGMFRERTRLPEREFIFKHALTQEAVYDGLLKRERIALHRRTAEALERRFADRLDEQAAVIAYHWMHGGDAANAGVYLLRAGDRARRLGASLEAVGFYSNALDTVAQGSPESSRLHEVLGDVYLENLAQHDRALEHYSAFQARPASVGDATRGARKVADVRLLRGELAEAQGHYEAALAQLAGHPACAEGARVHFGLSYLAMSRNLWDEALHHARATLQIVQEAGDTRGQADGHKLLGIVAGQRDELSDCCEHLEHSLGLYRELCDLPRTAQACNNLGNVLRLQGQMARALSCLQQGLELARRVGDTRDEALLLITIAEVYGDQGLWEQSVPNLEQALPLAEASGVAARVIPMHQVLGAAYVQVGRLEEARKHLLEAERLSLETDHRRFTPDIQLELAFLEAAEGHLEESQRRIDLAAEAAGPSPPEAFVALLRRGRASLAMRQGRWDEAVRLLESSLEVLARASRIVELGRAHLELARAYRGRGAPGDVSAAATHFVAAGDAFARIGAVGYLAQLKLEPGLP